MRMKKRCWHCLWFSDWLALISFDLDKMINYKCDWPCRLCCRCFTFYRPLLNSRGCVCVFRWIALKDCFGVAQAIICTSDHFIDSSFSDSLTWVCSLYTWLNAVDFNAVSSSFSWLVHGCLIDLIPVLWTCGWNWAHTFKKNELLDPVVFTVIMSEEEWVTHWPQGCWFSPSPPVWTSMCQCIEPHVKCVCRSTVWMCGLMCVERLIRHKRVNCSPSSKNRSGDRSQINAAMVE